MTDIKLEISEKNIDNLTWEQWELLDSGKPSYREAREIISLFVSGSTKEEAMDLLGKLKTSEMRGIFEQFTERIAELTKINPTKGGA